MDKLTYQEIFATRPTLAELSKMPRFPIYCLIENVRSLYNVGSIFRTSDAVRLTKLFLTGYTGSPPRKEIDKTALGAVESVPWQHFKDPSIAITELRKKKVNLIAVEHTTKSSSFYEFEFKFPLCIMLGNEVDGLSKELIKEADAAVEIPMFGLKQSLNVSVAYGTIIHFILNNYLKNNPVEDKG